MGGEYTQAQKKATKKYMENKSEIHIVVTKKQKEAIIDRAQGLGLNVSAYIKELIENDLQELKLACDLAQEILETDDYEIKPPSREDYLNLLRQTPDKHRAEREARKKVE